MKKIIFMGTPDFSAQILEDLIEASGENYQVVAVVSQPDKPVGRKQRLTAPPVKDVALAHDLPVFQPEKIADIQSELESLQADLVITAAYGQILPDDILNIAKIGNINVHASLLPAYRGASPIHHAVFNADTETGVSIIEMTSALDAGPIYAVGSLKIEDTDDTGTLFEKLSNLGSQVLLSVLPDILSGQAESRPQNDAQAIYTRPIHKDQEEIDWTRPSKEVWGQIRALSPDIGAYTFYEADRLKIWKARLNPTPSQLEPGQVSQRTKKFFSVVCGDGQSLDILEVQPSGKKAMATANFLNGAGQNMQVGHQLGD